MHFLNNSTSTVKLHLELVEDDLEVFHLHGEGVELRFGLAGVHLHV